jgi:hypothetical protein
MATKKNDNTGKYDYYSDSDFIQCFGEANGDTDVMNQLFGRVADGDTQETRSVSEASISQRRQTIRKNYGIKLRKARQSKFKKADRDEARAMAMAMGFEVE